jgi:hypothetical protein
MRWNRWAIAAAGLSLLGTTAAPASGRIAGTVTTVDGRTLSGWLRWDDHRFWDERIELHRLVQPKGSDQPFRLRLFGFTIADGTRPEDKYVPFGHLRSIVAGAGSQAEVELKSGERWVVRASGGGELNAGTRLMVEGSDGGEAEVPFRRIERIDFRGEDGPGPDGQRLFGTVRSSAGTFRGPMLWDADESTIDAVLDGETGGKERDVSFRDIVAIEPEGALLARVHCRDGQVLKLGGTNDVNEDNRGVYVTVPRLGRVGVPWDALERAELEAAPASPAYGAFDGGHRVRATIHDTGGKAHAGALVWDYEEAYSFDVVVGEADRIEYEIELADVTAMRPSGPAAFELTLRDGRKLVLSGLDRAIGVVQSDGSIHMFEPVSIARVAFQAN